MNRRIKSSLLIAILLQSIPSAATAGSSAGLSAGSASGSPGATRTIPITLNFDPEVEVSGLNFYLGFDPDRVSLGTVSLGSAASGKSLSTQPSPGSIRVIIFGIDAIPMSEGVVVNIQLNIKSGASPGMFTLALTNTTLSDPSGNGISHISSNGSFTVVVPTNTPEPTSTNTPIPTNTPSPSATPSSTPTKGPSPTPSPTPKPENTSPPEATHTPRPSPTASSTPTAALTPSATATSTPAQPATITHTPTIESVGKGLDFEAAAAATGTALAEFEAAVAATSTALAQLAARPADQIVGTGTSSGLPEVCIDPGLLLPGIVLGRGVVSLIRRKRRT